MRELGEAPLDEGDMKSILTQGKVVMADLFGDEAILKAMKTNEDDTNTAYSRALERDDVPPEIYRTLQQNLEDERRHRSWIEQRIPQL
jgi:uncharacterized protein (TIGR02284 family)